MAVNHEKRCIASFLLLAPRRTSCKDGSRSVGMDTRCSYIATIEDMGCKTSDAKQNVHYILSGISTIFVV